MGFRYFLLFFTLLTLPLMSYSADNLPQVVHSAKGDTSLFLINRGKRHQYKGGPKESLDRDVFSPKSVTFSRDGRYFYINSLEGCKTVIYDAATLDKLGTINYSFTSGEGSLWTPASGYYPFNHYPDGASRRFSGKPVESTWSHDGRYLWVPFYRRTFDLNAQDPSAIAVIDTHNDNKIVKMMETGPLPKMVATSPDGRTLAVTHWGDNTVGLIDISSPDPSKWRHRPPVTVGKKLNLDLPLDSAVNRDANSGRLLRGTVFTPDGRYLLVSGMGGPLSVIDVKGGKYLGAINELYGVRHLAIRDRNLYGSQNAAGSVFKVSLDSVISAIDRAKTTYNKTIKLRGPIKRCKVGGGARTLEVSPDGRLLFVACNSASAVYVVEASTMKVIDSIRVDSYPVGLAISPDGHRLVVTSQGRQGHGGNAVNVFDIK